ncbi:MAG TPA: hypothetical protein VF158_05290 [Longimicrobiales bacterium]
MLSSLLGIRLVLLIGDTVPLPAPYEVVRALTRVQVTHDARNGDGFQLTFALARDGVADYGLLASGALEPFRRVVIGVLFGATPEVLIDGVITHQQVTPREDPGASTLTVTGRDLSILLDLEEKNAQFPNQPDFVIVSTTLAAYAQYGIVPAPTPTTDVPIMLERIPRQAETDLKLIERLARRNGYVFYIEPVTFGVNTAYWGPENRLGIPQPALTVNMGADTNVRGLHFGMDALAPVASQGSFIEPISKTTLPIPPLPPLKVPPLALRPAHARRTTLVRDAAQSNPARAALAALAGPASAPDPVTVQGELDAVRYGRALRARRLVGVRGVGLSYDGLYYVERVSHTITLGGYTQSFTLHREGTVSTTPVVVP